MLRTGAQASAFEGLSVVPLEFDLSFDNFRTIRKCKMVWREGDFAGVQFDN